MRPTPVYRPGLFVALLFALSGMYCLYVFSSPERRGLFNYVMWIPALLALALRVWDRHGIAVTLNPLRLPAKAGPVLFSVFYPLMFIGLCATLAGVIGLAEFDRSHVQGWRLPSTFEAFAFSLLFVFGEEYGLRCYLLPSLAARVGRLQAIVLVGVVWAVWHAPFVFLLALSLGTADPLALCLVQMAAAFTLSFPFAHAYFESERVLPPMIMHWVWNWVNPMILGNIYRNQPGWMDGDLLIINGEGVMGATLGLAAAAWFWRRYRAVK